MGIKETFSKLLTPTRILVIVVGLLLMFALMQYSENKSWPSRDFMTNPSAADLIAPTDLTAYAAPATGAQGSNAPPSMNNGGAAYNTSANTVTNPADLLPKSNSSNPWGSMMPSSSGGGTTPDLVDAGAMIGTTSQVLRNANLQWRPDPIIPVAQVGPWNQSTIEPDLLRKPLDCV